MINSQGFQIVAEVTEGVLLNILQAAWKSGGDSSGEGVIPEHIELPRGLPIGPFQLKDGTVQILPDQVGLDLNPDINGINIKLGVMAHLEIENPPVESATFFDLTADVTVKAPLGNPEDNHNLGLILTGLPQDAVDVKLTSGDPIAPIIDKAVEEFIHQLFQKNGDTFPHVIEDIPIGVPPFSMLASIRFFDDESNPQRRITVAKPVPDKVQIDIPCYIRFYDINLDLFGFSPASPMGITATARATVDYREELGRITAQFSSSTVSLVNIQPAPGEEGANYTSNAALVDSLRIFFPALPPLNEAIATGFAAAATPIVRGLPNVDVSYPTVPTIETEVENFIRAEFERRKYIMIWSPETGDEDLLSVENVTPKVLSDTLAIAINRGVNANPDALVNFIPTDSDFATILDGQFINQAFEQALAEQFPDGFPHRLDPSETGGRKVDLRSLSLSLRDGSVRVRGSVTVRDVGLFNEDIDAKFTADFGLRWIDAPGGGQTIEPFLLGEPDVDVDAGLLSWLLGFLIGVLTGFLLGPINGLILGIVSVIVINVIADSIGAGIFKDELNNIAGIGAWPPILLRIGTVQARFEDPIDIFSNGVRLRGSLVVSSTFALTTIDFANSHGPYALSAASLVNFDGGPEQPDSTAAWTLGDGTTGNDRNLTHRYGDSGLYIAKLQVGVNQPGGATTRHFAKVKLQNVPPTVSPSFSIESIAASLAAGVPSPKGLSVKEGEEFEIIGTFTDIEWLDRHTAYFVFGDNTKPIKAIVEETNTLPEARGTARATHIYCQGGAYNVRLIVEDDDGGIGEATFQLTVDNVAPDVTALEKLCVLVGQQIVLQATFTDKAWCDKHTALWDFGDCTEKQAIVTESSKVPTSGEFPISTGIVEACHVYQRCGVYLATVRVLDSHSGVGEATITVNAVSIEKSPRENGCQPIYQPQTIQNLIVNGWYPYQNSFPETIIDAGAEAYSGIYQTICANQGWDYEFQAHYLLPNKVTKKTRIGIDPRGGNDPASPNIVWMEGESIDGWQSLAVRATAMSDGVSLYIEEGEPQVDSTNATFWDQVQLCSIQPVNSDRE